MIQDKEEYLQEGLKHLSDTKTYRELPGDATKELVKEITTYV